MLLSFLLAILLPTIVISYLYYASFAKERLQQVHQNAEESLLAVSRQIELLIDNINAFSVQLSMSDGLKEILTHPEAGGMYKYNVLKENLNQHIAANNMLYSLYLYMPPIDSVLTTNEGMFKRTEFYDQALLDQSLHNENSANTLQLRKLVDRPGGTPLEVFTFVQGIPPLNSYPLGLLAVNVRKEDFFRYLGLDQPDLDNVAIVDGDDQALYRRFNDKELQQIDRSAWESRLKASNTSNVVAIVGDRYMMHTKKLAGLGWTIVRFDDYSLYQAGLYEELRAIVRNDVYILLAGLLLSYLLSLLIHRPWKTIASGLADYFRQAPALPRSDTDWVAHAVNNLIRENRSFQRRIKTSEPVIRDRFIYDVLTRNYSPKLNLADKFHSLGIGFDLPAYLVMFASTDHPGAEAHSRYNDKLLVFSYIDNKLNQTIPAVGTILENSEFGFILNIRHNTMTTELKETLFKLCREINDWILGQLNVYMQFSFSEPCEQLNLLSESYEQAKSIFQYKAVMRKADVVFYTDYAGTSPMNYPLSIQKQLLFSLAHVQRDSALLCIEELFQHYIYNQRYPLDQLHEMILLLTSAVKSKLLEEGLDLEATGQHIGVSQIFACANSDELYRMMISYMHKVFNELESQQDGANDQYIRKAADFIERNYARNVSISDIAEHVGLSNGYLSRHFKAEIGKSPLEFLTEYRIGKSKELMKDPRMTMQEISERIGYVDVNSFIRYFKKYEGVTPGKFRSVMSHSETTGGKT
jgi:AraC-like DNA-binding protein